MYLDRQIDLSRTVVGKPGEPVINYMIYLASRIELLPPIGLVHQVKPDFFIDEICCRRPSQLAQSRFPFYELEICWNLQN
jgi:hypothetical protein